MLKLIRRLLRNERGVAATELALMGPPLIIMFVGLVEITFKLWSTQKAEKVAVTLSDVVAQSQTVTTEGLGYVVNSTGDIMAPFEFEDNGMVIISSVYRAQDEETPTVNWQCTKTWSESEEETFSAVSKIGTQGSDAILPDDLTLNEKENVIVAEVFYTYEPILPGLLFDGDEIVYRRAFFKPRLGALTNSPGASCTL